MVYSERRFSFILAGAIGLLLAAGNGRAEPLTDAQIRQRIISQSIANYPGSCACPYSLDRRGHRCGGRSAYSRPGGYSPLCYPADVSDEQVSEYRRTHTP